MEFVFDTTSKKPLKIVYEETAYDVIDDKYFSFSPSQQEHFVEISQASYEKLAQDLKRFYNVNEEYATELTAPILNEINKELKKYGI